MDEQPEPRGAARRRLALVRLAAATMAVVLVCGGLFVVSAQSSEGTDLRPGRYDDLAALTDSEADRAADLQARVAELTQEVRDLTDQVDDDAVRRYQQQVEALEGPAGLTPRTGPGVVVTLSDAPDEVVDAATGDKNLLVVHQQDIQAVVNAMWKGGAEAVVIQGQRMVTTTGIKCEGNSVMIQGVPYPQPYVIEAVGDVGDLTSAIADDDYLQIYREQSDDPAIAVGWDLDIADEITAPAYDGLLDLSYATPISPSAQAADSADGRYAVVASCAGGRLGRQRWRRSVVGRRRGRRLVGRHEQRDRRPLRLRLTTGRQLVGDRAPRLGRLGVAPDVVLEARVDDLLDRRRTGSARSRSGPGAGPC